MPSVLVNAVVRRHRGAGVLLSRAAALAAPLVLLATSYAAEVQAQIPNHLHQPERWKDYEPGERRELRQRFLRSLPEETRSDLRNQARRFRDLPDSNKRDLCHRFHEDRGYLPPACQHLLGR